MKNLSLLLCGAIVLLANGIALNHAARNRAGAADAELSLTEREVTFFSYDKDDSDVTLRLMWQYPNGDRFLMTGSGMNAAPWLSEKKVRALGFDCSVPPSDARALDFYRRQLPRAGFVAMEYDGAAWRNLPSLPAGRPRNALAETHLIAVDAGPDAEALRRAYPDRHSVIIVPAVIRIAVTPNYNGGRGAQLISASIETVASTIHAPLPFSEKFRQPTGPGRVQYKVALRWGRLLEPWVTAVEFP